MFFGSNKKNKNTKALGISLTNGAAKPGIPLNHAQQPNEQLTERHDPPSASYRVFPQPQEYTLSPGGVVSHAYRNREGSVSSINANRLGTPVEYSPSSQSATLGAGAQGRAHSPVGNVLLGHRSRESSLSNIRQHTQSPQFRSQSIQSSANTQQAYLGPSPPDQPSQPALTGRRSREGSLSHVRGITPPFPLRPRTSDGRTAVGSISGTVQVERSDNAESRRPYMTGGGIGRSVASESSSSLSSSSSSHASGRHRHGYSASSSTSPLPSQTDPTLSRRNNSSAVYSSPYFTHTRTSTLTSDLPEEFQDSPLPHTLEQKPAVRLRPQRAPLLSSNSSPTVLLQAVSESEPGAEVRHKRRPVGLALLNGPTTPSATPPPPSISPRNSERKVSIPEIQPLRLENSTKSRRPPPLLNSPAMPKITSVQIEVGEVEGQEHFPPPLSNPSSTSLSRTEIAPPKVKKRPVVLLNHAAMSRPKPAIELEVDQSPLVSDISDIYPSNNDNDIMRTKHRPPPLLSTPRSKESLTSDASSSSKPKHRPPPLGKSSKDEVGSTRGRDPGLSEQAPRHRPPPLSNPIEVNTTSPGGTTTKPRNRPAPLSSADSPPSHRSSISSNTSTPQTPESSLSSLATLELEVQGKMEVKAEDFDGVEDGELGHGNGGTVSRVVHRPSSQVMARKVVHIEGKPAVRKQIVRELQILRECDSPYIVAFYGAYVADPHVCMCMEYMDKKSLEGIYKKTGPIPVDILGKIAFAVISGLTYLYDLHRILHRDVKPANILANSAGQIKICDFGVSGELVNSIAATFVGTSTYMSPERIQGSEYSVRSDVWSLGISLIELALGQFPFSANDDDDEDNDSDMERPLHTLEEEPESEDERDKTLSPSRPENRTQTIMRVAEREAEQRQKRSSSLMPPSTGGGAPSAVKTEKRRSVRITGVSVAGGNSQMSILELLQNIVNEPAPKLPSGKFPEDCSDFVDACLWKDVKRRPTPKQLLNHKWMKRMLVEDVDLIGWASKLP